jgi:DNA repair protein RecN (Recombination protein N)
LLQKIYISNFIIIDELEIEFSEGFTAITGETGTGKSIIIDAIEFCLGRFQSKVIKKYQGKNTFVKIYFYLEELANIEQALGFKINNNFSITKMIDASNKASITINNKQITNKLIKKLAEYLINIVFQFDTILNKEEYIDILDKFMVYENKEIKKELRNISDLYFKIQNKSNDIYLLEEKIKQFDKDRNYNLEIIKNLESIGIKENEETELLSRRSAVQKLYSNQNLINNSLELITSIPIEQKLTQALRQIEKVENKSIQQINSRVNNVLIEISDIIEELTKIKEELYISEKEIEEIDDRISVIRNFARKYNTSSVLLFEFVDLARKNIHSSDILNKELIEFQEEMNILSKDYDVLSETLSNFRKTAAEELSSIVCSQLKELQMKDAIFKIETKFCEEKQTICGKDSISFLANFNKKSDLMPINEIASGGEVARLNFALKTVLSVFGNFKTIVFDEVDIGIGGAAAYSMGRAMKKVCDIEKMQVISITHSPQVAAQADSHIVIRKTVSDSRIMVFADNLHYEDRVKEIARMISGASVNTDALLAAKQLLK